MKGKAMKGKLAFGVCRTATKNEKNVGPDLTNTDSF